MRISRLTAPSLERVGLAVLVLLAAALRLWHLNEIPSPTDELLGVSRAIEVVRGTLFPLTDEEPYIGSLWTFMMAAALALLGTASPAPRLLTLVVGALTVIPAYLLGRELGGRAVGWSAALLLAASSGHILASSHPAWSHCLVPLFATLGYWQLARSLRLGSGPGLLLAGVWFGLALQSHLTSLALLPGAAVLLLRRGPAWLRTPYPYLGAVLALAFNANLIAYNALTGMGSFRRAMAVRESYAGVRARGPELYVGNLGRMGLGLTRTVSGAIDIRDGPSDFLLDPLTVAPALLALAGLCLFAGRGELLPAFVALSYLGLLVLFNSKYEVIPNARFLTPVAPLLFACVGAALVSLAGLLASSSNRPLVVAGLTIVLGAISLLGLGRRYEQMANSVSTSLGLLSVVDQIEAVRRPDEAVLLDRNLDKLWLDGGGDVWMALSVGFQGRGAPIGDLPSRLTPRQGDVNSCDRQALTAVRVDLARETPAWLASILAGNSGLVPQRFWTFRVVPRLTRAETLGENEQIVFQYLPPISGSARTVDRCAPGRLI
jgi:4-amino-4-deoxy-L-arabinose transferase-like glycosyltransferase